MLLFLGLLSTVAIVGLYSRLREIDAPFAVWALVLQLAGAFGAAIHGGYDLANAINPPGADSIFPSAVDPRGLLTFGVGGIGLFVMSWQTARCRRRQQLCLRPYGP